MKGWHVRAVVLIGAVVLAGVPACSSSPTVTEPEEEVQKVFTGTRREHHVQLHECLVAAGYEMELVEAEDGSGYDLTSEVEYDFDEVFGQIDACNDEIGHPPPPPSTDEELRVEYEYRLEDYECLTAAGYPITDPPSFSAYLESHRTTGIVWNPYEQLQPVPAAALEACPRDADTWWR